MCVCVQEVFRVRAGFQESYKGPVSQTVQQSYGLFLFLKSEKNISYIWMSLFPGNASPWEAL